jgi:hypothetical protein
MEDIDKFICEYWSRMDNIINQQRQKSEEHVNEMNIEQAEVKDQ